MTEISDRINFLIEKHKVSQEILAEDIGISQAAISKICQGRTKRSRFLPQIADYFSVTEHWLLFGDAQNLKPANDSDDVFVPFYPDIQLSAGHGASEFEDYNGEIIRFPRSMLRDNNVYPKDAVCVVVKGDSMEPIYRNGSTVAINLAHKRIIDGDVYAINNEGLLQMKRLKYKSGNVITVESYNREEYPAFDVSLNNIEIIGRVFWYATTI